MGSILRNLVFITALMIAGAFGLREYTDLFDTSAHTVRDSNKAVHTARADVSEDGRMEIAAGPRGHYHVAAEVNGETLKFLVDTGASLIALGSEAAETLGFNLHALQFDHRARTANGIVSIALVTLDEVTIGELTLRDVEAAVHRYPIGTPLLGMSFLRRLESFGVRDGKLILRW